MNIHSYTPKLVKRAAAIAAALCAVLICSAVGFVECVDARQMAQQTSESIRPVADYAIGAGDALEITVWKNAELSKTVAVRPDGKISIPLLGEMVVEGKSISQLSEELREGFSRYISQPVIYVSVQQATSMYIYVIGRVNGAGARPIHTQTNVLQGLAMASGLTPFAKGDQIKIFRTQKDGTTTIFDFDYDAVSRGKNLSQNILLQRGDVIVVP